MPNYCTAFLTISGDGAGRFLADNGLPSSACSTVVDHFVGDAEVSVLDAALSALVPEPRHAGPGDWMEWREAHWGTKSVYELEVMAVDDEARLRVVSAWRPPLRWLRVASAAYPRLAFRVNWSCPGDDRRQHAVYEGGSETRRYSRPDRAWLYGGVLEMVLRRAAAAKRRVARRKRRAGQGNRGLGRRGR